MRCSRNPTETTIDLLLLLPLVPDVQNPLNLAHSRSTPSGQGQGQGQGQSDQRPCSQTTQATGQCLYSQTTSATVQQECRGGMAALRFAVTVNEETGMVAGRAQSGLCGSVKAELDEVNERGRDEGDGCIARRCDKVVMRVHVTLS